MWRLSFACLLCGASLTLAQDNRNVLPAAVEGGPPRRLLQTFLLGETGKQFDVRRQAIAGLKTPEDVRRRQQELRERFIAALGGFPDKTPLNAKVVGSENHDGFILERVIYESRPQHHVTANLYLPVGKGPFPGVILPCGHSANGKASVSYQRMGIALAKHGIAALCYDPIGQGERRQLLDNQGKAAIAGSTSEHTMTGIGALLIGQNTASYRVWDGIRSLDYLASRPEIDPKRLGCTGVSGGGTLTSYLMALDDRILAAAPSCYITSLERLFATLGPQDAEQNITGQVAFGMDHADYLTMRAPKPTLICAATRDFFDIQGTWTSFREAKRIYGVLGHGERIDLFEYDTTHGYPQPQREAILRWMRRWLQGIDDAATEGEFPVFTDPQLQCTRTGQVLEDFQGKSVFDLNAEREQELATQRSQLQAKLRLDDFQDRVRQLIAIPDKIPSARLLDQQAAEHPDYQLRKLRFVTEKGIQVPALEYTPKQMKPSAPLVLYVNGEGKGAGAAPGGPIEQFVKAGQRVLALDPRGLGETAPGPRDTGKPSYFGPEYKDSFLSLHLNRPLLGQRVYDLLAVVDYVANAPTNKDTPLHLVGVGVAGPVALHAAFLEPRIQQLTLDGSLLSWSNVVRTPISYDQLSNVVPGALAVYDLPDLAARLAPRPLTIRSTVDAVQKPVAQTVLEQTYAPCRAAYQKHKADQQLTLTARP
ncbi:MAG: alpha/beta hydrolase family protein [Gemmataceae bacterium]